MQGGCRFGYVNHLAPIFFVKYIQLDVVSGIDLVKRYENKIIWQLTSGFLVEKDWNTGKNGSKKIIDFLLTLGDITHIIVLAKGGSVMFHKAIELKLLEGTSLEVAFQDGIVKRYDMGALFQKYPQLKQLEDRDLFLSGRMMGAYGIVWNDDLDIETETIYEDGVTVREERFVIHNASAHAVAAARAAAGISQKQLAALTGIDQSDISKIERGIANPSVATLDRIANALGGQLMISIKLPAAT